MKHLLYLPKIMGGRPMRQLKRLAALTFALFCCLQTALAYDFSAVSPSGHTIYYNIVEGGYQIPRVSVTYPNTSESPWGNIQKPYGNLVLPETVTYNGTTYNVTYINEKAFYACAGLVSVVIPSCVISINYNSFTGCESLTTVTINSASIAAGPYNSTYNLKYLFGNQVTSYTIGAVSAIGCCAFYGCTNLASVTLHHAILSIDNNAFYGCSNMYRVNITDLTAWLRINFVSKYSNPLYYAHNLYLNGTKITDLTIPNGVSTIKQYAFLGCSMTSVNIPNYTVTSIGNSAFESCSSLTSVYIGNSVTSIGENAFRGCTGLPSVFIPSSITVISAGVFRECSNLTSVDLPNGISQIGNNAFYNCSSLTDLVIPDEVPSTIGAYAFCGCSSLTSVTIPSTVNSIGNFAFSACGSLTSVTINSNAIASLSYSELFNMKNKFGNQVTRYTFGSNITSIGQNAFYDCTGMAELILPSSLSSIGNNAFQNCSGLNWVLISDLNAWYAIDFANAYANPLYYANHFYVNTNEVVGLTVTSNIYEIKDYAFVGYKGLHSVNFGNSVTSIGNSAFENCSGLTSLTIGNSVNTIGDDAFKDCTNLTSVTLNNSEIAAAIYTASNNLKNIFGEQVHSYTFGSYVSSIGQYACYGCTGLTSLTIPYSVSFIRTNAFYGCTGLTSVTFQGTPLLFESQAFGDCTGLTRVNINNLADWCGTTFEGIKSNPLSSAHHLYLNNSEVINLNIPNNVTSVGQYAFYGCSSLQSVVFPDNVTSIGISSFSHCTGLNALDIPSTITSIGDYAFKNCTGLASLTLPNSMNSINSGVFYGCSGLTEIHVGATVPPVIASSTTFGNVPTAIPVYVPLGSAPSYQAAQYWSRFTNYVGAIVPGDFTVTVPYEQEFYQSFIPGKWTSYEGQLVWDGSINKYTANLSTNSDNWFFGYVNGVFLSSHAWANIGNTNHAFWLVSPIMHLDGEYNMLSFDMALTQASGFLTPVTPGAQNNTCIFALVSTDHGLTWTKLEAWKHGLGGYTEIESLTPHATTLEYNLASFADQDIMVGFYMECTNANDAANRVHIDNFFVGEFDPSTPPTVAVDNITGYTATVSWTPAFTWQQGWDFYYKSEYDGVPYPNYASLETLQATGRFFHLTETSYALQNLTANTFYQVWVRHRDGSETGSWSSPLGFTTTLQCAPPQNPQVVTTQTTAYITWEPGQPNQTSWEIYVDPGWDMGEELEEPFFYMDGLTPGTAFEAHIFGHCTEGDGDSDPLYIEFSTDDYDHLTVNDEDELNSNVVIIGDYCGNQNNMSETQFVIPAEWLTDMQYSTIEKMSFYCGDRVNSWGNAEFKVYLTEIDESNFANYCGDSFVNWSDMSQFYQGRLSIDNNHVMTIESQSGYSYHYTDGNLVVGIKQYQVGSYCQDLEWLGGSTTAPQALYEPVGDDPQCELFIPEVTFTYEVDHYEPPTEFMAYPTSSNEVYFGWMPSEGATAYEIEVSESPDFDEVYDQHLVGLTGYEYTWVDYDLLEPDNTYFARIRALYQRYGIVYGSSWSESVEFMTLDACPVPTDLTAIEVGNLIVELDWTETGDATEWVIAFQADGEVGERYLNTYHHPYYLEAPYLEPGTTYIVRIHPLCPNGGFVFCEPITFTTSNNIDFADQNVKALCVANWDTDDDDELSFAEAAVVTTLGDVFKNKTNITSFNELKFFTGLTTINNNAFYNCSQLRSVVVPNGVTTLDSYAFQLCTSLISVTLPTTLTEIQSNAFRNCSALTAIEFPEGLITIGEYAFYGCTSLFSIFIPASVTTLTNNPFVKTNLSYIYVDPENTVFDSRDDCNAIIKKANNQLVVGCKNTVVPSTALSIWDYAFRECVGLTSIYIPENIKYIYSYAFYNCSALTSVNIPSQVTKIYLCSFYGCSGLSSITIPSGVTEIQQSAFNGCTGLTEITVLASTPPTIGVTAFAGVDNTIPVYVPCESLGAYHNADGWSDFSNMIDPCIINFADQNVKALCVANWDTSGDGELSYTEAAAVTTLGEVFKNNDDITTFNELQYFTGLTSIVDHAFGGCGNLTSIVIPVGVTSIGTSAFSYCPNLTTVILPEGVTSIGNYAFMNDALLTGIDFPESLSSIGAQSFDHCTSMTYLFIPASVTSITNTAFLGCSGLEYISVAPGNTVYDSRDDCNAIIATNSNQLRIGCKNTIIPNTVTSVGPSAFRANTALTSIDLPESITAINDYAFFECSALSSITLPASLTSLGQRVFYNCVGLQSITVEAAIPPTIVTGNQDSFYGIDKAIPVYVPCASFGDYQNCNGSPWGGFTNIVSEGCLQTITLNGGWNWWAPTIEMELGDIETNLGNRGILILSQNEGFARYENAWSGTLSEVGLGKMYKIQLTAGDPVLFEVEGGLSSGTAVTIEPGFNWIGYTGPAGLSIAEALGSFEPSDGDEIIDENGDSVYYDGENWEGNFTSLNPGKGYLYHSVANETKTITF